MFRLLPRALALVTAAALLSACSSAPDLSKPGSWLDTIAGGNGSAGSEAKTAPPPPSAGDKPALPPATQTASGTTNAASQPVSDSAKPKPAVLPTEHASAVPTEYPNLSNQQDLQTAGATDSQRREIRDSLVSDRDKAQHSAEVLRGGTETPAAPPPPAPAKPADAKPADAASTHAKPADGSPAPTN